MYIFQPSPISILLLVCLSSSFAATNALAVKSFQLEINTLLQIQTPNYIGINDCLHIETNISWQTLQVIAAKINHWHKFEIRKDSQGLLFLGDICK